MDALLSGMTEPEDAPAGLRPVAEVLAALQAPPDSGELVGWNQALAAFREAPGAPEASRRRPSRRSALLSSRLAAAAAATTLAALGGGIAAAYAGILPPALQRIAHHAIAAPGVSPDRRPAATVSHPVGPDVSGSAAHGLCIAYARAEAHGNATERSTAFRKLVDAAGGADKVAAYCQSVPGAVTPHGRGRPGPPAAPSPAPPKHHGKPTGKPGHGKKS